MSRTRSNSQGSSNPATKYLGWDTQASAWEFYDKENKKSCTLPSSTAFIVLDQLNTAKGWDDRKGGLWSNEVRSVADQLTIRSKDGVVATGTWSEVKATNGIKFTKSVYAMAKVGEGYELVNFQLKGCALTAWIEFQDSIGGQSKLEGDVVVAIKDVVSDKKGAVSFNKPVFGIVSETLSSEASIEADWTDAMLQEYLDSYFNTTKEPTKQDEFTTPPVVDEPIFDNEDPF
jgi:hypothetical protein